MRSAMAPETMVAAVAQNTVWKMTKATGRKCTGTGIISLNKEVQSADKQARPQRTSDRSPEARKPGVPTQKSIRFFMMILPAFLARVNPVSTMAKPACIKNTSAAPDKNPNRIDSRKHRDIPPLIRLNVKAYTRQRSAFRRSGARLCACPYRLGSTSTLRQHLPIGWEAASILFRHQGFQLIRRQPGSFRSCG